MSFLVKSGPKCQDIFLNNFFNHELHRWHGWLRHVEAEVVILLVLLLLLVIEHAVQIPLPGISRLRAATAKPGQGKFGGRSLAVPSSRLLRLPRRIGAKAG